MASAADLIITADTQGVATANTRLNTLLKNARTAATNVNALNASLTNTNQITLRTNPVIVAAAQHAAVFTRNTNTAATATTRLGTATTVSSGATRRSNRVQTDAAAALRARTLATRAANAETIRFNQTTRNTASNLRDIAVLGAVVGIGLGAGARVIRAATTEYLGFNAAVTQVQTILRASDAELKTFSATAQRFARQFGGTPTDQVNAYYQIISAGITDNTEALAVWTAANQAAVAGAAPLVDVVDALTTGINNYGDSFGAAINFTDAYLAVIERGRTTLPEFSRNIANILPQAFAAGVSLNNILAPYAALTSLGINDARTVTRLQAIIRVNARNSDRTRGARTRLGITADPTDLPAYAEDIFNQTRSLPQGQRDTAIQELANRDSEAVQFITASLADLARATPVLTTFNRTLEETAGLTGTNLNVVNLSDAQRAELAIASIGTSLENLGDSIVTTFIPAFETIAEQVQFATDNLRAFVTVGTLGAAAIVGGGIFRGGSIASGISNRARLAGRPEQRRVREEALSRLQRSDRAISERNLSRFADEFGLPTLATAERQAQVTAIRTRNAARIAAANADITRSSNTFASAQVTATRALTTGTAALGGGVIAADLLTDSVNALAIGFIALQVAAPVAAVLRLSSSFINLIPFVTNFNNEFDNNTAALIRNRRSVGLLGRAHIALRAGITLLGGPIGLFIGGLTAAATAYALWGQGATIADNSNIRFANSLEISTTALEKYNMAKRIANDSNSAENNQRALNFGRALLLQAEAAFRAADSQFTLALATRTRLREQLNDPTAFGQGQQGDIRAGLAIGYSDAEIAKFASDARVQGQFYASALANFREFESGLGTGSTITDPIDEGTDAVRRLQGATESLAETFDGTLLSAIQRTFGELGDYLVGTTNSFRDLQNNLLNIGQSSVSSFIQDSASNALGNVLGFNGSGNPTGLAQFLSGITTPGAGALPSVYGNGIIQSSLNAPIGATTSAQGLFAAGQGAVNSGATLTGAGGLIAGIPPAAFAAIIAAVIPAVVGRTRTTGSGIENIFAGANGVTGNNFETTRTSGLIGLSDLITRGTRNRRNTSDLTFEQEFALNQSFNDIRDRVGTFTQDFNLSLDGFALRGNNIAEVIASFDEQVGAQVGGIDAFRQSGETFVDTLERLSTALSAANSNLRDAGLTIFSRGGAVGSNAVSAAGGIANLGAIRGLRTNAELEEIARSNFATALRDAINPNLNQDVIDRNINDRATFLATVDQLGREFDFFASVQQTYLDSIAGDNNTRNEARSAQRVRDELAEFQAVVDLADDFALLNASSARSLGPGGFATSAQQFLAEGINNAALSYAERTAIATEALLKRTTVDSRNNAAGAQANESARRRTDFGTV